MLKATLRAYNYQGYSDPSNQASVILKWEEPKNEVADIEEDFDIWLWIWIGIAIGVLIIAIIFIVCMWCYRPRVIACFEKCKRSDKKVEKIVKRKIDRPR